MLRFKTFRLYLILVWVIGLCSQGCLNRYTLPKHIRLLQEKLQIQKYQSVDLYMRLAKGYWDWGSHYYFLSNTYRRRHPKHKINLPAKVALEKAIRIYRLLEQKYPHSRRICRALYLRALIEERLLKDSSFIKTYLRLLSKFQGQYKTCSELYEAHYRVGVYYLVKSKVKVAIHHLQMTKREPLNSGQVAYYLGVCHMKLGAIQKAKFFLRESIGDLLHFEKKVQIHSRKTLVLSAQDVRILYSKQLSVLWKARQLLRRLEAK